MRANRLSEVTLEGSTNRPRRRPLKVFVVDDERHVREALRVVLEGAGYDVVCYEDGAALLEMARKYTPACIFLDVFLPGRSGFEILKELTEYPAPVLMMSGKANIPMAVKAIRGGAANFIQKPFRSSELLNLLAKILEDAPRTSNNRPRAKPPLMGVPGREPLSDREREVVQILASGSSSSRGIGLALGISHRTAEDHRANIMKKLGVRNVVELMTAILR